MCHGDPGVADDAILSAALRHFAEYGLGAAKVALHEADAARVAGDTEGHAWWMGICQSLDRRLARRSD